MSIKLFTYMLKTSFFVVFWSIRVHFPSFNVHWVIKKLRSSILFSNVRNLQELQTLFVVCYSSTLQMTWPLVSLVSFNTCTCICFWVHCLIGIAHFPNLIMGCNWITLFQFYCFILKYRLLKVIVHFLWGILTQMYLLFEIDRIIELSFFSFEFIEYATCMFLFFTLSKLNLKRFCFFFVSFLFVISILH